jgi:hypothetical protein
VKKPSIPEYTGFEIGKTGIIPVSVLRFQYRIGNTNYFRPYIVYKC